MASRPSNPLAAVGWPKSAQPLPSLNALQAFEVAARHLSFTRAALELGVTQTAISHQVRGLEHELEVSLFRRAPQRLSLTAEGRAWAAELHVVFAQLRELNRKLRSSPEVVRPGVSISVIPSFGSRWLVPRLGKFLLQHPELDIRISASERLVDFAVEPFDVGIRYGFGRYPGLVSTKLVEDSLVVVASAKLHAQRRTWQTRDLLEETLIQDDFPDGWERWFAALGARLPAGIRRNELSDSAMVVEAALCGHGVALARRSLAADELKLGRLVELFPKCSLPTGLAYYLVSPRETARRKAVAAFRAWVQGEVANSLAD
jgi:LysR family transcriptional regulator, glycine cleavage system transcriptional activator